MALAGSIGERRRLRAHLREVREHGALFDTRRFVRNLEAQFQRLVGEARD